MKYDTEIKTYLTNDGIATTYTFDIAHGRTYTICNN